MGWRGVPAAGQRAPNQAYGYTYGYGPLAGGSGSGMGQAMNGPGTLAQGISIGGQTWHPTILYLFALTLAEMVVFALVGNLLK